MNKSWGESGEYEESRFDLETVRSGEPSTAFGQSPSCLSVHNTKTNPTVPVETFTVRLRVLAGPVRGPRGNKRFAPWWKGWARAIWAVCPQAAVTCASRGVTVSFLSRQHGRGGAGGEGLFAASLPCRQPKVPPWAPRCVRGSLSAARLPRAFSLRGFLEVSSGPGQGKGRGCGWWDVAALWLAPGRHIHAALE